MTPTGENRHREDLGTDQGAIEKTTYDVAICARTEAGVWVKVERLLPNGREEWMSMIGTPAQLVDVVGEYEAAGADQLCLEFPGNDLDRSSCSPALCSGRLPARNLLGPRMIPIAWC